MSNRDSIRDDGPRDRLYPMDPDRARYHCEKLRALADLLRSGAPVRWVESHGDGRDRVTVELAAGRFAEAHIGVRRRIAEGHPDYTIRVEPKPRSQRYRRSRMGR